MDQQQYRVDHQVLMSVLKTLAKIGPHADPVFRDECECTVSFPSQELPDSVLQPI